MNPYMFVVKAVPDPDNEQCSDIAGANVHVWVMSDDGLEAQNRAIAYIEKHRWRAIEFEHGFEIRPETIRDLGKSELRLYKQASQYGIAADFLAYPKKQGNTNDPVEIRRMQ